MNTTAGYRPRITARYTLTDLATADLSMMTDIELADAADRAHTGTHFGLPVATAVTANVAAEREVRAAFAAQLDADIAAHGGDFIAALLARF